jgi:hypothetical protein
MSGRTILVWLVMATFLACSEERETAPPPDNYDGYQPPTTIENVLKNLRLALERGDITEYSTLLSRNYVYAYNPSGSEPGYVWTLPEDIEHATEAFSRPPSVDGYRFDGLTFNFEVASKTPSPLDPRWMDVVLEGVVVSWDLRQKDTGESLHFKSLPGYRMTLTLSLEHGGVWTILYWQDEPPAGSGCASWGGFKSGCWFPELVSSRCLTAH